MADRPQGHSRGLYCTDSIEAVIEERKMRKENACDILEENGSSQSEESNCLKQLDLRGVMTAPGFSVKKDLLTQIKKTPEPPPPS